MSERPRILQLGPSPALGGGMAAAISGLLASPLAEDYELDVVSTYDGPQPLSRVVVFLTALVRIVVWSLRGRGKVVHVHATVRGSALRKSIVVLLAKALRRRVILHVHSGPGDVAYFSSTCGRPRLLLIGAALRAADVVLAVSEPSAAALHAAGVTREIEVVPNAAPLVQDFVRRWEEGEAPRIAYLGGFANTAKGADTLVAALREELARRPDLRVTLAGPGEPDPEAAALIAAAPGVEWIGWLDPEAKDALLRDCEIFVLSSRSEGMPMALLEAMGYWMAVVATAVGAIPELVETGETGMLVPAEDPAALAAAIEALLVDPPLRRRVGEAGRARVERLDDVEVARRLETLYRSLGA
jgi:glycosyltransferase involved in cell wall biosynthesis